MRFGRSAGAPGRRAVAVTVLVGGGAALAGLVLLGQEGLARIDDRYVVRTPVEAMLCLSVMVLGFLYSTKNDPAGTLTAHARRAGWRAIDPERTEWPWAGLRPVGTVTVRNAWSLKVDGFPVTAGTIEWSGDALSGMVDRPDGTGVFAVVHLAEPVPSMAMHVPLVRGGDSPLLELAALRASFLRGTIPPWTARDRTLFTVEPTTGAAEPEAIGRTVTRALRVTALLGLDRGHPFNVEPLDDSLVTPATDWTRKAASVPVLGLFCYLVLVLFQLIAIGLYAGRDSDHGGLLIGLLCSAMVVAVFGGVFAGTVRARFQVSRHAGLAGWEPVRPAGREWPWAGLRRRGVIKVRSAWAFRYGGLPITAGRVTWRGGAFGDVSDAWDGEGVFVVVLLPEPVPSAAMRLPRRLIGEPVNATELWSAFERGDIPPWTVSGRELFVQRTVTGDVRPATIEETVRAAVFVARLLEPEPTEPEPTEPEPTEPEPTDSGVAKPGTG
jgi:hypothetical protein